MRSISCTPVLPGKVLCSSCQELTNLITKLQKRRQSAPLLPVEESTQVDDSAVIELAEIQSKVKNPICRWANCAVGKLDTVRDLIEHVRSYHIPTQSGAPHQRSYKCEWEGCTSIPKQKKQLLLNHITDKHTGKYWSFPLAPKVKTKKNIYWVHFAVNAQLYYTSCFCTCFSLLSYYYNEDNQIIRYYWATSVMHIYFQVPLIKRWEWMFYMICLTTLQNVVLPGDGTMKL